MLRTPRHIHRLVLAALILGTAGACASSGGAPEPGGSRDRRSMSPGELARENDELDAEVARLRVERDRLAQTNQVLEDELRWAHEDLRLVELQFSEFEHRMSEDLGKAAAVSAAAEARIHLDRARQSMSLPDSTSERVGALLATADRLIRATNYPAGLFFAERANHTLQGAERRASLNVSATTRIIAVSAANVREGPGQHYPVVATLPQGLPVSCLDVARSWCHIVTPDGATGWVHVSLLR
jgi:hypothetical protein